jgi:hypothetical protein
MSVVGPPLCIPRRRLRSLASRRPHDRQASGAHQVRAPLQKRIPGYLVSAGSNLTRAWGSSDREAIPSFGYTRYRCAPTVRCDRNKRSAISRLESPDAAICAIWSSCGGIVVRPSSPQPPGLFARYRLQNADPYRLDPRLPLARPRTAHTAYVIRTECCVDTTM